MIFKVPGAQNGVQIWAQNGVQNEIPTKTPLKTLLDGSWDALGRLLDQKKVLLIGSWAVLQKFQDSLKEIGSVRPGQHGNGKRIKWFAGALLLMVCC